MIRLVGGVIKLCMDDWVKFVFEYVYIFVIECVDGVIICLGDIVIICDLFKEGDYFFCFNGNLIIGMEVLIG